MQQLGQQIRVVSTIRMNWEERKKKEALGLRVFSK